LTLLKGGVSYYDPLHNEFGNKTINHFYTTFLPYKPKYLLYFQKDAREEDDDKDVTSGENNIEISKDQSVIASRKVHVTLVSTVAF